MDTFNLLSVILFSAVLTVCHGLLGHRDSCENKEAFQCENLLHHQLDYNVALDTDNFCSYLISLKNCLLNSKCSSENTTKIINSVKSGLGVTCSRLGDRKTEMGNGCNDPAYTSCIHKGKEAAAEAALEKKLAQDYVCSVTMKTNDCLKDKAFCNKKFREYRVHLSEQRFGLTCASPTMMSPNKMSTVSTLSAALLIMVISRTFISVS